MAGIFDTKYFNAEVFAKYVETIPRAKQNALLKAGVLRPRADLAGMLSEQTGGNYIAVPMSGLLDGAALNYDGKTDITADGVATYMQNMIVVGRAKAWQEKDFAFDVTGHDFMADIAAQTAQYWDDVDQETILSTLKGVFGVTAGGFSTAHTLDISDNGNVDATSLNVAVQQAAGDNKNIFTVAIMHSVVATNLENLQVLEYFKQSDANGLQRSVALASWNGRTVLVDDSVPVEPNSGNPKYTTYLLGQGAFDYCDCGAKVPVEVWRDPKTAGGLDMLINRQRKVFAPRGLSFVQPTATIMSPTNTELETAARWTLVKDTAGTGYIDHKTIPIARIISKG